MTLGDIIALALILIAVGGATVYIVRQRKKGKRCIGCPSGGGCNGQCCSCATAKK